MSTVETGRACPDERLCELVQGGLGADEAQELEEHVTGCPVCARELRWLSAEQVMFTAHAEEAPGLPNGVWDKIAARTVNVAPVRPKVVRRRTGLVWSMGLAAAAAVVAFVGFGGLRRGHGPTGGVVSAVAADASLAAQAPGSDAGAPRDDKGSRAALALDAADRNLDEAIAQLQQDYQRRRGNLPPARARRYDEEFTTALSAVEQARSAAGKDVAARRQVVRARARYLRSIQAVVLREGRS